jgi:dihydroneopterin aldolase
MQSIAVVIFARSGLECDLMAGMAEMVDNKILAARFYTPQSVRSHVVLDRIGVRGLVRDVEIGVFQEEKGRTQRVRFSVEVSIFPAPRRGTDDIEDAVSYDYIIEAIGRVTSQGHIHLLETLAERVAEQCLADRRAAKVHILVEKLDRLEGSASLCVEIERQQPAAFEENVYALPWAYGQDRDKTPPEDAG